MAVIGNKKGRVIGSALDLVIQQIHSSDSHEQTDLSPYLVCSCFKNQGDLRGIHEQRL